MKHLRKRLLTLVALLALTAGAWAQVEENIFQYCYDCQRSPAYPKTTGSASLSSFKNPYVGYNGSGIGSNNTSAGPWKLEYLGIWSSTDNHGINSVSTYQSNYNCTDVPVFRLYQWNATANEYQHAAYGVVCCYAKVSNAVEHTALFVSEGGLGCVLTNSSHSTSMSITFDEDLTTGLATLIAGATPGAAVTPEPAVNVTQITTDLLPASWATDENNITLADLQDLGFEATDYATAAAWTGAPQDGFCYLYYAISGSEIAFVYFTAGSENDHDQSAVVKAALYHDVSQGAKYFYTGTPAIELTKVGDNQWSLAETPDYDLELLVEYYDKYTLDSIPLDWQVKVGNAAPVYPTAYTEGNTTLGYLAITETDSVELIPPAEVKPNVKSVTLVEPVQVQTVTIDGITLDITGCTTWADIIARNPGVLIDDGGWVVSNRGVLDLGGGIVLTYHPYDPAQQSNYAWVLI